MLSRVENASIEYRYGLIFAKGGHVRLHLGNKMYKVGRITLMDFRKVKVEHLTGSTNFSGVGPVSCC